MGKKKPKDDQPVRLIGVDPGIGTTGLAAFVQNQGDLALVFATTVSPGRKGTPPQRLACLASGVNVELAQFRPDVVIVEENIRARARRGTHRMLEATGAIAAHIAHNGFNVVFQPPDRMKKAVRHAKLIAACPGLEGMTTEDNEHELDAAALVMGYLRKKPKKKKKRAGRRGRAG